LITKLALQIQLYFKFVIYFIYQVIDKNYPQVFLDLNTLITSTLSKAIHYS